MNSYSATTVIAPPAAITASTAEKPVASRPVGAAWRTSLGILAISAVVIAPCFWHRYLEAGDLGSHIYNAWLVQLISRGQAPGLWVASQWNNIFFDLLLSGLSKVVGLNLAARISAAFAILIFFWGAFAFVYAITRRAPWHITPLLAMVSYGWTFNRGFFNYYLSLGLAFFALAVFCSVKGWARLLALLLVPFIYLAHPLGVAWFFAAVFYIAASELIRQRFQLLMVLVAAGGLAAVRVYLALHFRVDPPPHSIIFFNGLDQLLFTNRYGVPILALVIIFAVALVNEAWRPNALRQWLMLCAIPLQLYLLVEVGIQILPDAIYLPQYAAPIGDLSERLTLISAVLLTCVLGAMSPRKWHLWALGGAAIIFFGFLYQDTGRLDRMESRVESLVSSIPPGQRILLAIRQPLNYRFSSKHILALACLERCFAYGNYEAPTRQFRVRALPGNPIVAGDIHEAAAMEEGSYVVEPGELPLFQIYQCGSVWTDLCIRPLQAGEINGAAEHRVN